MLHYILLFGMFALAIGGCGASEDSSEVLMLPASPEMKKEAPAGFKAEFKTTKGAFLVQVTREWAPLGAASDPTCAPPDPTRHIESHADVPRRRS